MSDQRLPIPGQAEGGYIWRLYSRLVEIFREQRPAAGWKDLLADMSTAKTGGGANTAPGWAAINGTNVYGLNFGASATTEAWINFHIPHDVAYSFTREDGTVQAMTFYPHVHWMSDGTDTGTVRFGLDSIYFAGYGHAAGVTQTTVYFEQASDGTAWKTFITETDDDDAWVSGDYETDGLFMCRIFRDGGDAADTLTDDVIIPYVDLHYYSDGMETNERNRDSTGIVPWTKKLMGL